jgi:hypothetical protein
MSDNLKYISGDGSENVKFPVSAGGLQYVNENGYWTAYDAGAIVLFVYDLITILEDAGVGQGMGSITVSENITIQEDVVVFALGDNYVSVFDLTTVSEVVTLAFEIIEVNLFNLITIAEDAQVSISAPSAFGVDVFDGIIITDDLVIDLTIGIDVLDTLLLSEETIQYLDVLNFNVTEEEYIVINEHVDVIDLVVEVGIVVEYNYLIEDFNASLDVLSVEVFDEVSTIEDIKILLPLLLIVRADNILVEEARYVGKDLAYIEVYDEYVTVNESIEIFYPILNIEVSQNIAVEEWRYVLDETIELGIVMEILIGEELLSLVLDVLNLPDSIESLFVDDTTVELFLPVLVIYDTPENILVQEVAELLPDVLYTSVSEEVFINEHIDVIDLVVELGIVAETISVEDFREVSLDALFIQGNVDTITLEENLTLYLDILFFAVSDVLTVEEDFVIYLDVLNIVEQETLTISEDVALELPINAQVVDVIAISEDVIVGISISILQSEDINIEEAVSCYLEIYLAVGEDILAQETVEISLSALHLFATEPFYTLITEHVDVVDLVVEVGVVMEAIEVFYSVSAYLDILFSAVSDDLAVEENLALYLNVLNVSEGDGVIVGEDFSLYLNVLNIILQENLSVEENVALYLSVGVFGADTVSIEELSIIELPISVDVLDDIAIIPEDVSLELVFEIKFAEILSVNESISILLPELNFKLLRTILVTEHVDIVDLMVEVGVVAEDIYVVDVASVIVPQLLINVNEIIAVNEYGYCGADIFYLSVVQGITVSEYAYTGPTSLNIAPIGNILDGVLLHFDSYSLTGQSFRDEGKYNLTNDTTPAGDIRWLDTSVKKFGAGSAKFFGASNSIRIPNDAIFTNRTQFTLEGRLYFETTPSGSNNGLFEIYQYLGSDGRFDVIYDATFNRIRLRLDVGGVNKLDATVTIGALSASQFYTIRITNLGRDYYVFLDGIKKGKLTATADFFTGTLAQLYIGFANFTWLPINTRIDEVYYNSVLCETIADYTPRESEYVVDDRDIVIIGENVTLQPSVLNINKFDGVTVSETVSAIRCYSVSVIDTITVSDVVSFDKWLEVFDEVTVDEYINFLYPFLSAVASDVISISEVANLNGIMLFVSDAVEVIESVELFDIIIELGIVYDVVPVSEVAVLSLSVVYLFASEVISSTDVFMRDLSINFSVAEQRGICLVQVSGW